MSCYQAPEKELVASGQTSHHMNWFKGDLFVSSGARAGILFNLKVMRAGGINFVTGPFTL